MIVTFLKLKKAAFVPPFLVVTYLLLKAFQCLVFNTLDKVFDL